MVTANSILMLIALLTTLVHSSTFQILKAAQNLMNDAPSCSSACENAEFRQQAMPMRGDEGPKPQVLSFIDAGQQGRERDQELITCMTII